MKRKVEGKIDLISGKIERHQGRKKYIRKYRKVSGIKNNIRIDR